MKQRKTNKKLTFNKETIAGLNLDTMQEVRGGDTGTSQVTVNDKCSVGFGEGDACGPDTVW